MASSSSGAVAAPGRGAVFVGSRRLCCEGLSSPPHGSPARRLPQGPRAAETGPGIVAEACSSPAQGPALSAPCVALLGVELGVRRVGLADGVQRVRLSATFCLSRRPYPVLLDVLCLVAVRRRPPSHAALPCVQVCSASACKARPLSERAGTRRTHWRTRWPRR